MTVDDVIFRVRDDMIIEIESPEEEILYHGLKENLTKHRDIISRSISFIDVCLDEETGKPELYFFLR